MSEVSLPVGRLVVVPESERGQESGGAVATCGRTLATASDLPVPLGQQGAKAEPVEQSLGIRRPGWQETAILIECKVTRVT